MNITEYINSIKDKDIHTYNHIFRICNISKEFGKFLGFRKHEIEIMYAASLFHDAGKLLVDNSILTKRGKLTTCEYNIMKKHTINGVLVLESLDLGKYQKYENEIKDVILNHHYINGYSDTKKPTDLTQIISIIDIYEALTAYRSYKKPMENGEAIEIIKNMFNGQNKYLSKFIEFNNMIREERKTG